MPKIAIKTPKTLGTISKIEPLPKRESITPNTIPPHPKVKETTKYSLSHIKKALLIHYTQTSTYVLFQRFKLGAMIFFLGLVIIYGGYQLLEHSLLQEIVFLIGISLIGGGFLLAMLAQVRMLIGRLIHILFHKHRL